MPWCCATGACRMFDAPVPTSSSSSRASLCKRARLERNKQSYKPSSKHFQEILRHSGFAPRQILHVAESIFHGLATIWVHRHNGISSSLTSGIDFDAQPDLEVEDLR